MCKQQQWGIPSWLDGERNVSLLTFQWHVSGSPSYSSYSGSKRYMFLSERFPALRSRIGEIIEWKKHDKMNELIYRVGGVKQNDLPLNYTRFIKLLRLFHIFRTAADNHHDRSKQQARREQWKAHHWVNDGPPSWTAAHHCPSAGVAFAGGRQLGAGRSIVWEMDWSPLIP